jgi:hypothetical protein
MSRLLGKNLLRFGVKNLNESTIKKLQEQDPDDENNDPSSGTVTQTGTGKGSQKGNPDILVDTDYLQVSDNVIKRYKRQNPNFDSQLTELKSHPAYKLLLERLSDRRDEGGRGYSPIEYFYLFLTQDSRKKFLDQTLAFTRSFTKKRKLQKQLEKDPKYTGADELYNFEATLAAGKLQKYKIPVEKGPDEIEFQAVEIPLEVTGATVYKDNSIEPAGTLIQAIENWTKEVQIALNAAKQVNPNVIATCSKIDIASSCSRLRNTNGMTWMQLSQGRANEINKRLTEKLKGLGVLFDPKMITTLRGGYNGDGSSGPDPAQTFTFRNGKTTKAMSYSKDGKTVAGRGPDAERYGADKYGGLLQTAEQSDPYKFCTALVKVIIKADEKKKDDVPMQPSYTYERGYTLELAPLYYSKPLKKLKPKKGAYKGPGGSKFKRTKTGISQKDVQRAKKKLVQCPAFFGPGT